VHIQLHVPPQYAGGADGGALRAHPQWRDVVVEASSALFGAGTVTLRPDVRAVRV